MQPWTTLISFAVLSACAAQVCCTDPLDPTTLDPTDFDSAVIGYGALVDSKPYASFVKKTMNWVCMYHYIFLMRPACSANSQGKITDPGLCCKSIKAFVNPDQGKCLCQERVVLSRTVLPETLRLIAGTQCGISFPIPKVPQQFLLPKAIAESQICQVSDRNFGFTINPKFFPQATNQNPDELPTFRELYTSPPSGPYSTSYTVVNVTRPTESILVNDFSTPTTFRALVAYPSDKRREQNIDPATGAVGKPVLAYPRGRKFPIVAFSPGFTTAPELFLLRMKHLASLGMVVIGQASTSPVDVENNSALPKAWADDIAYGLRYLSNEGCNRDSFLYHRVDNTRAGIAGHSFGAVTAFSAVRLASDLGIGVRAMVALEPACVPFSDICDQPGNASLDELQGVDYLVVTGGADKIALPSHGEYVASLVEPNVILKKLPEVNHCLLEADPKLWLFGGDCGIGQISPMEQVRQAHELTWKFFKDKLVDAF